MATANSYFIRLFRASAAADGFFAPSLNLTLHSTDYLARAVR